MRIIQTKGILNAGVLNINLPSDLGNGEVDVIVVSKNAPNEFDSRHHDMIEHALFQETES